MAYPVKTPKKGLSADSVIISEWFVEEGEEVAKGDIILSVETNKAVIEVEAESDGMLLKKFVEAGEEVPVLANVAVVGEEGEEIEEFYPESYGESEELEKEKKEDKETEASAPAQDVLEIEAESEETGSEKSLFAEEDTLKISPRAQKLAAKHNLDYKNVNGSGPGGRIIERDIEELRAQPQERKLEEAEEYTEVSLSNMRKQIAENMYNSVSNTAQFTINSSFDASSLLNYRKNVKESGEQLALENITINDLILFGVSRTLLDFKDLNAHYLEDKIRKFHSVHLGMAVHTEKGLMVPTLDNAHNKSLNALSKRAKELAQKCRGGNIEPRELEGATFTVTNLGKQGIETFAPILNPPQVAILGVGTIEYKIKKEGDDFQEYPAINLSLTIDHQGVDGAPAASFMQALTNNLEKIDLLLAK